MATRIPTTSYTVIHNLGTRYMQIIYDEIDDGPQVCANVLRPVLNAYRVVVQGRAD